LRSSTNDGFTLGNEWFQRQIALMVGRRTWRGQSGRPKKPEPDADQLDLPI
jgi:putative transposase